MHFLSRLKLNLERFLTDEPNKNIHNLHTTVHDLHKATSDGIGATVYDPADGIALGAPTTVLVQNIDKMYIETNGDYIAGTVVYIGAFGGVPRAWSASSANTVQAFVLERLSATQAIIAFRGVVKKVGSGYAAGTKLYASGTAGEVTTTAGTQYLGFSLGNDLIYFSF